MLYEAIPLYQRLLDGGWRMTGMDDDRGLYDEFLFLAITPTF